MQLKNDNEPLKDKTKKTKSKPKEFRNELPKCENEKYLHRDISGKTYEVAGSPHWGVACVRVQDPTGRRMSYEEKHGIKLPKNFPKIPWALWERWVQLCFELCKPSKKSKKSGQQSFFSSRSSPDYEVQVTLLRKKKTFDEWKFVVPKQEVSKTRVDADLTKSCDIVTGEIYDQFPPEGWCHAGSSHSHNTMKAFFSHTDDDYELKIPGVHIVNGEIDVKKGRYVPLASIAFRGERKDVSSEDIIDFDQMNNWDFDNDDVPMFHSNCLDFISIYVPTVKKKNNKDQKGFDWSGDGFFNHSNNKKSIDLDDPNYDAALDLDLDDPNVVNDLLEGVEDLSQLSKEELLEIMEEKMDSEMDYWWEDD
jgi:hypothetical protein